jgi:hypothetical protein
MMTEPWMVGGLIVLITMMGVTALIVGTVAHAKGGARGYAQGHLAGLEQGRGEGRADGYTAGLAAAATANPQVIRTPHVAHWERARVSDPQVAAARLRPASAPAVPRQQKKTRDGRGSRWGGGVVHTQEFPIGRHAATSTEIMPAVTPTPKVL